jgi:quinol monooxygenase YgiN
MRGGDMLIVVVQVRVKAECLEEFEAAILENAARAVEREPGCLGFEVNQRGDDPAEWLFYERYTDAAAFEAHRRAPHFLAYQAVAERVLLSKSLATYVARTPHARTAGG